MAERNIVDRRIVARDLDRLRVDVGRDAAGAGPKAQRRKSEQARAGAHVGNVCELAMLASENIELLEAAGSGCMLARAECQAGIDLERSRSRRDAAAVGRGMDEEAAGMDRLEPRL